MLVMNKIKDFLEKKYIVYQVTDSPLLAVHVQVENIQQGSVEIMRRSNVWKAKQEAHFKSI